MHVQPTIDGMNFHLCTDEVWPPSYHPLAYRARTARPTKPTQPATILPAPEVEVLEAEALLPVAVALLLLPEADEPVPVAVAEESVAEAVPVDEVPVVPFTWLAPLAVEETSVVAVVAVAPDVEGLVAEVWLGASVPVAVLVAEDEADDEEEVEPSVMLNWFCWVVSLRSCSFPLYVGRCLFSFSPFQFPSPQFSSHVKTLTDWA